MFRRLHRGTHKVRATAMLTAGVFAGQMIACTAPGSPTEVAQVTPSPASPPLSTATFALTGTDREIASLLAVSQDLGADASCSPAARGGMSAGISALTARWSSTPNLDDLANSPEVLWITGYLSGQGVITCGFARSTPDPDDAYLGWRRTAWGSPPFEIMMPCAVAEPFVPPEELPMEMLAADVGGDELTECTGTPPPPPDPNDGGGDPGGGDPGGGDPGGGDPGGGDPGGGGGGSGSGGGPVGGAALSVPPHAPPGIILPGQRSGDAKQLLEDTLAGLRASQPALAAQLDRLQRDVPGALDRLHDSGKYAKLPMLERARAEISEVTEQLIPGSRELLARAPKPSKQAPSPLPASKDGDLGTLGAGCGPCVGYLIVTVGELLATIAYISKIARAGAAAAKAEDWAYLISLFIITAGTLVLAWFACVPHCPPAAASVAYIGSLVSRLTNWALDQLACLLFRILFNAWIC